MPPCSQVAGQVSQINMSLFGSRALRYPRGLWWHPMDICLVFGGNSGLGHRDTDSSFGRTMGTESLVAAQAMTSQWPPIGLLLTTTKSPSSSTFLHGVLAPRPLFISPLYTPYRYYTAVHCTAVPGAGASVSLRVCGCVDMYMRVQCPHSDVRSPRDGVPGACGEPPSMGAWN